MTEKSTSEKDTTGWPEKLPCDVMVAPATCIGMGCSTDILRLALSRRDPADAHRIAKPPTHATWSRDMDAAPRDGTRILAMVDDEVRVVMWAKTSHVPIWGFCLADQGVEDFDICQPTAWLPLPAPPAAGEGQAVTEEWPPFKPCATDYPKGGMTEFVQADVSIVWDRVRDGIEAGYDMEDRTRLVAVRWPMVRSANARPEPAGDPVAVSEAEADAAVVRFCAALGIRHDPNDDDRAEAIFAALEAASEVRARRPSDAGSAGGVS